MNSFVYQGYTLHEASTRYRPVMAGAQAADLVMSVAIPLIPANKYVQTMQLS